MNPWKTATFVWVAIAVSAAFDVPPQLWLLAGLAGFVIAFVHQWIVNYLNSSH